MNLRSILSEKEAEKAGAHEDQGNTSTLSSPKATQVVPPTATDISRPSWARAQRRPMSMKVRRTLCLETGEPRHHNDELANDVRVSPTDEHVGVTPDCCQPISSVVTPNSKKSTSFESELRSPCECLADLLLGALGVNFISKEACQSVTA